MSVNILETKFVFIDSDLKKVDSTRTSLLALNTDLNNLGKGSPFGKNIADSIKPAENALDSFKTKINDSVSKPTISRYWEAEENKTVSSLKAIENAIAKTNSSLSNIGSNSIKTNIEPNKPLAEQPKIKFAVDKENFIDLDKLQKKADETRKSFADISAQKLNSGNIGVLSKEIVTAHERSKQLVGDIKNIKTELANPNRKSSVRFLTDELIAAEREADRLNRKLSTLPNSSRPRASGGRNNGQRGGITNAQATFLEFADDFAPEGLNRAFNAAGRAVFAAQNIKDTAKDVRDMAKDMSLFSGLSITSLATFGAIAATGYLIVDATSKIRAEAEKRLKIENELSAAGNRQILAQKEALRNLAEQRQLAAEGRNFSQFLEQSTINDLEARKRKVEQLINITPQKYGDKDNPRFQILSGELGQIDAQITSLEKRKIQLADSSFNQRNENFKKSQESAIEADKRQIKSLEEIKNLKVELNSFAADSLSSENPFIKLFADADSAGERMEKRFKTLGDEYVKLATVIERNSIAKKINELKFSNNLSALKINQDIRRTDQLPNNQRFEFTRGLENLNQISDFALNFNNLSRKLAEANFYSDKFNPNNPKSFAEYNRRGINDDISETGLQIRFAVEDIRKLNSIDLQGTGVYGQGAIADKILSIIPSREELLRRLNNPLSRNDAQYLLNQQSNSLSLKRDFETQKINDFFEQQKYSDLRRTDAREQLNFLKNSTGLDKQFANQQFLKITDELGVNNLSKDLLQGRRDAQLEAVKLLGEQFRKAQKEAEDTQKRNEKLETFLDLIVGQLRQNGLKIDGSTLPSPQVFVDAKDFDVKTDTGASGTQDDVRRTYFDEYN